MTFEEYKKAKLRMETKMIENWGYAYSISVFKKNHPQKAAEYEARILRERTKGGQGDCSATVKTDKEKIEEIMSIRDTMKRHKAIAENMDLFSRAKREESDFYEGRTAAELQKRSEIMAIKDRDIRYKAIAENLHLFEY